MVRGPGSGMSMSSFLMDPGPFSFRPSCDWKRARFCWRRCLGRWPSSRESRSRMRRGSSWSASWSTRSPVSLQSERSDSEDGVSKDERALSLSCSSSR
ncbi:hypothetical protein HBI56_022260 [Parastagonospora nodorum]|uniref:Uncharacterized protein n=1 Tax=Phaeosphaeria nodorum (strain SN15 / ATCC MYA-4574 / FGSC 10173) TaxID=321614 RepID=A0A7U2F0C0_PHANO|nr:hypothetical protein HBH56_175250 [Parastagonospora nodorum]QRC96287.1 hypothetical protein JI435_408610 [Parastagonospora nodorum SN15]KAH3926434.1 hypothetical protein HBH54_167910 [Parastagonospora nodorum]KAH3955444.1 hypothetical protein HBH53_000730 [Parastagonospora nodorum]KAH3965517.1 hypothetical protein HBH52_204570 [Parastagonospora nodorum]